MIAERQRADPDRHRGEQQLPAVDGRGGVGCARCAGRLERVGPDRRQGGKSEGEHACQY